MHLRAEIARAHKALMMNGLVFMGLTVIFALLMSLDNRMLEGVTIWNKPFKFGLSIALYFWTLGLTWPWLSGNKLRWKWIPSVAIFTMWLEIGIIVIQVIRGEHSHFNLTSPFNVSLFATMGVLIVINSMASLLYWLSSFFGRWKESSTRKIAFQWGWGLFLLGSIVGGVMSANLSHTVGEQDTGTGLLLMNWNRVGGDIRVAHFIGLHAIQVLIFLSLLLPNRGSSKFLLIALGILFLLFTVLSFLSAMQGYSIHRLMEFLT